MTPEISILLPVFNEESCISNAIESVLNQSFKNFELILLDDGSTDHTFERVVKYNDERIRVIQLPHRGLVDTLNEGINLSRSKYIARMDADDLMHSDRLMQQYKYMEANPEIGVVSCLVDYGDLEYNQEGYKQHCSMINQWCSPSEIYNNRFVDAPVAHPSVLIRKEIFANLGFYHNGHFPEDYQLWLRWMESGVKFAKVKQPLMIWNDRKDRLSRNHSNYEMEKFFDLKSKFFSRWFRNRFTSDIEIWICGHGKEVRKKVSWLIHEGLTIKGYVDVKEHPNLTTHQVIHYNDLKSKDNIFILNYVADRKGRVEVENWLNANGYRPGKDFYMMC